jgi:hypothetical protein
MFTLWEAHIVIGTHPTLLVLILTLSGNVAIAQPPAEPLSLWYRQPARQWVEALAVGNGRLGAMVFGGVSQERIQLNEDTLWAGGPYDPANPDALEALPKERELIFAGQYREAHNLIGQKMMAKPLTQMPYQCVGDLLLEFPDANGVTDYRRDLNLDTAVATVAYTIDGVRYTREVFSSPVDQVIVIRLKADKPGKVTFTAQYFGDARCQRGLSCRRRHPQVSGPCGRCDVRRTNRARGWPDYRQQCGFRITADRGGDQLQEVQRRDRRSRSADQRHDR